MGNIGQNEPWAGPVASKLSERRPPTFFHRRDAQKHEKWYFFRVSHIYGTFWSRRPYMGSTMWKLTSGRIGKCDGFLCYDVLNPSYGWSKSTESEILSSSSKIVGVKKKRHGFIKPFWDLKWIGYQTYHVRTLFYSYDDPQCNIEAVSFFFNAANLPRKILRFDPTLSSHNSSLKSPNLEKYHIFGKPWTSAFTWLPLEKSY